MDSGFSVNAIIGRSNRNRMLLSGVVLALVIGVVILSLNYYNNMFNGPFAISNDDLAAIENGNSLEKYYVTVAADDVTDTGYTYVKGEGSNEKVERSYVALSVGDRYLLVEQPGIAIENTTMTGVLAPMPGDVQREVVNDIYKDYPRLDGAFLPVMMRTRDPKTETYIGLAILALAGLAGLWGISGAMRRMANPASHGIMKALSRFGDADQIAQQIEYDMGQPHDEVSKGIHFTRSWLVRATGSNLEAARWNDVAWIYKKVTQHRTNGIPTGKTYAALVYDRHGKLITFTGKEKVMDELLGLIAKRSPWAIWGYTADIEKKWKKERQTVLAAVDQRRQETPA
ncbi:MAG: DUF6709 family protein [Anaerolineae bacterium]